MRDFAMGTIIEREFLSTCDDGRPLSGKSFRLGAFLMSLRSGFPPMVSQPNTLRAARKRLPPGKASIGLIAAGGKTGARRRSGFCSGEAGADISQARQHDD